MRPPNDNDPDRITVNCRKLDEMTVQDASLFDLLLACHFKMTQEPKGLVGAVFEKNSRLQSTLEAEVLSMIGALVKGFNGLPKARLDVKSATGNFPIIARLIRDHSPSQAPPAVQEIVRSISEHSTLFRRE